MSVRHSQKLIDGTWFAISAIKTPTSRPVRPLSVRSASPTCSFFVKRIKSTAIDTEAAGEGMDPPLPPRRTGRQENPHGMSWGPHCSDPAPRSAGLLSVPQVTPDSAARRSHGPQSLGAACRMQTTMRFRLGLPSHSRTSGVWCGAGRTRGQHESPCLIARVQLHTTRR